MRELCFYARMLCVRAFCILYLILCCLPEVFQIANAVHQINEEIIDKEVRLIGPEGEQLGIMSAQKALEVAIEHELDLVKIAPG